MIVYHIIACKKRTCTLSSQAIYYIIVPIYDKMIDNFP